MLNNLQALRTIAALMVVLLHVGSIEHLGIKQPLLFGHAGVDLFFVISGFVMVYTISKRPVGAGAFFLNRVIRIVPLYWAFTAGLFLLSLAGPLLMQPDRSTWAQFVQAMLFIPYRGPAGGWEPLYFLGWTLNMEMAFYALFALCIASFGARLDRLVPSCVALIVLTAVGGAVWQPTSGVFAFYSKPIVLEFALGMTIAYAYVEGWILSEAWGWLLLTFGSIFLLTYPAFGIGTHQIGVLPAAGAVVAAATALEHRGRAVGNRFVMLVGAASYALYLCHPFATAIADRLSMKVSAAAAPSVAILFSVLAAVALAILIHLLFERPINDLLRRAIGNRKSVVAKAEDRMLHGGGEGPLAPEMGQVLASVVNSEERPEGGR